MQAKNQSTTQNTTITEINDSENIEICPVCFEEYSTQRKPMVPPCDHLICKLCVDKLTVKHIDSANFKCPMCKV